MLVLDAEGRIELASPGACRLWQAKEPELVGDHLPNLFLFDVTSREPDWLQAQWEVLQAAALPRPLQLKLQPKEAGVLDALVRLEKCTGEPVRYFAFISLPAPAGSGHGHADAHGSMFSVLAERSPLGFFDLNFLRNEVYYAPAWKAMLGYGDSSLADTYDTWLSLIHPDDTGAAPDRLAGRTTSVGGRPFSVEYRLKHAHGHYLWVQSIGVQVFGPNGALQRVVGAHLDIQDRKEFEESSLHADERMQALTERGRMAVFDLDLVGDHTWLSPAFKGMLGYAETELPDTNTSFLRALPASDTTGGLPAYFLTSSPGQAICHDTLRMVHRNGADLWVYAGYVRLFSRRRELQRVLGFLAPLPEGVAAAGPGGLSPEQLAALLEEMREGALVTDAHGQIVYLNPAAARLLGQDTTKALGQPVAEHIRLVHRLSGAAGENPLDRALALGEPTALNNEFSLDRGSGKPQPITFSCRPAMDASGVAIGAVLVFRNPEEMTLTPEELVRANRFESLGQLASGIAHDFNNLLTTILGGVTLAKESRNYDGLDASEKACLEAKGLSKQLLAFAKGGAATRQNIKALPLIQDAKRLASAGSAVQIDITAPDDLGIICVDRAQLLQVFQNFIINSIQAMPSAHGNIWVTAGNVTLTEGQIPPLAAGAYVAVEVRDNGSGIKPEHLERIFDPFFTTKKTGTGLGLATVHSIVKRHGGQIGVDSELGVGTAFTVFLPRAEVEADVVQRSALAAPFDPRRLTGRILFMDDDPHISHLTGGMLEQLGYKFDLAKNGEEAVQLYKRYLNIGRPYDVVIMDLTVIGGMGGEQCFKVLRDLDPNVRAVVASGYDSDDMARQFLDMGFCDYLTKPYRGSDLGKSIKKITGV